MILGPLKGLSRRGRMMKLWKRLDAWARWLLPPQCQLCGLPCPGPEDLCPACRPTLRPLPGGLEAPRGTARRPFAPFCYGSGARSAGAADEIQSPAGSRPADGRAHG